MKLRLSLRARDDLREISSYIRARNPAAALRGRDVIRNSFAALAAHPHAGRA